MKTFSPYVRSQSLVGFVLMMSMTLADPAMGNEPPDPSPVARQMARAAKNFLDSLSAAQRGRAVYPFDNEKERRYFHFFPIDRNGLPLKDLNTAQQQLAYALISTGLSHRGFGKAATIMSLGQLLREQDGADHNERRDSDHYYITVFGTPGRSSTWSWRAEGFHLSLNFTIAGGKAVASKPSFFGSIPATVQSGPRKGLQVLRFEEAMGRRLAASFDGVQRKVGVIPLMKFEDTVGGFKTGNTPRIIPEQPEGISLDALHSEQAEMLMELVSGYAHRLRHPFAQADLDEIEETGIEKIHFAWAGSLKPFEPHYYKIQGPTFLIEYDNTQDGANHVHTVWRDFDNDFGEDMLRKHKAEHH